MEWWKKTIVYELYPKSFLDTTGSGTGDLNGVIEKLDYLESLGVGAVWMTPVCRSPMVDNGYDISDYCSIDPVWGTMEDFDRLVKEAKKRKIGIVMDLVFNHTSEENPWFIESKQNRTNPKANWYIWRDAKEDGSEPTNWRGIFGGSAWTWCEERKQYYLHTFASQQPDLNWAEPEVRRALYDAANFWIDKGAVGFRVDAVTYIRKPDVFADGPADGEDGMVSVHDMTANTPGILDYLHEWKREVTEGKNVFTVAEANGVSADELKYWVGKDGAFDMLFEFSHVNLEFKGVETWCRPDPWTVSDLKKALRDSQKATEKDGWYPIFFENHDKPRSNSHYFAKDADRNMASMAIGTVLMTLRGTPFLYQGQELGYANMELASLDAYDDISTHGQYAFARGEGLTHEEAMECVYAYSRDNARTPMQWNDSANAGFTSGTPWLPVHAQYRTENVEAEERDPKSVLQWFRKLKRLREEHPALMDGTFEEVLQDSDDLFAWYRTDDAEQLLIIVNFKNRKVPYDVSLHKGMKRILGSYPEESSGIMRPLEAAVWQRGKEV